MVERNHESSALAPIESKSLSAFADSPLPIFTGAQMAHALTAYRELQIALDRSMPDQIMNLDGKPFRKKGYWRAIAVAFGLTVEPIEERREVNGQFTDGRDNFGYIVSCKATAPNGRSVTSDGSCFAVEKARRFKCPHLERPGSRRTLHFPHHTCPDFDPAFQWRVLPADATEHNVRGHAHTRAFNRAVSNLVGFGEVSAEEVTRDELHDDGGPMTSAGTPPSAAAPPASSPVQPPQRKSQTTPGNATVRIRVAGFGEPKHGTTAKGPWTKWFIKGSDGKVYGTFRESDQKLALDAQEAALELEIAFTETAYGRDIKTLSLLDREPGDDEAPL